MQHETAVSRLLKKWSEDPVIEDESMRTLDEQGFMHVKQTNISKANVCPYRGNEIPDYEALKLDPNKIYKMLRPADELKKAEGTFNLLPLMDKHIPVSAFNLDDPEIKKHYVGTTGDKAAFDGKYLTNSLAIHTVGAIEDVMQATKRELSCGYRYTADMTPGSFNGENYDGRMTNIIGNHVALVDEGRCGPDVMVADEKPKHVNHYKSVRCAMDIAKREDVAPNEGKTEYGNVTFADSKNKKYPLDTIEHVKAAASYWGMPKNKAKYSPEDQVIITKRIKSAEHRLKIGEFAE